MNVVSSFYAFLRGQNNLMHAENHQKHQSHEKKKKTGNIRQFSTHDFDDRCKRFPVGKLFTDQNEKENIIVDQCTCFYGILYRVFWLFLVLYNPNPDYYYRCTRMTFIYRE